MLSVCSHTEIKKCPFRAFLSYFMRDCHLLIGQFYFFASSLNQVDASHCEAAIAGEAIYFPLLFDIPQGFQKRFYG